MTSPLSQSESHPDTAMVVDDMNPDTGVSQLWGLAAEFSSPAAIMAAAKKVRAAGYRWWDCHTPFPVHGLDFAMGINYTILPIFVFFGGLTGTCLALILQVFTNSLEWDIWAVVPVVGYQFEVSGKPLISLPAFIPVMFELTVLFAALTAVGSMLLLNKLPCLYHPVLKSPKLKRATDDRFYLVIETRDPKFVRPRTEELLESLGPDAIIELEA